MARPTCVISIVNLLVFSTKDSKILCKCKGALAPPPFGVGYYVTPIMWVRPSLLATLPHAG